MKTIRNHSCTAKSVTANHSSWQETTTLTITSEDGSVEDVVCVEVTPKQLQNLLKQGRNALIDAKVIRGKKQY
jgi:hypothetical protein